MNPPTDYILHFTIESLGTTFIFGAILLFTNNINLKYGNYGDRTPDVSFRPSTRRHFIITGPDAIPNDTYYHLIDLALNIKTCVRIEVLGTMRKICIDNTEVSQKEIGTRYQIAEVDAYLGTLRLNNNDSNAMVSNVIFTSNPISHSPL